MTGELHLVRLAEVAPAPWRNGGGVTRELLAWPAPSDWLVRVSVATIERSGPFSAFPGVERWFAVIDGGGVRLGLPGGEVAVTPPTAPVQFAGETAPAAILLGSTTRDLNLMTRRDAGVARMTAATTGSRIDGATRWRGVFAGAPLLLETGDTATLIPAETLVWAEDAGKPWTVRGGAATRAWLLTLADRA